jgi:DNA-binding transcriptional LysR family regulator
MKRVSDADLKLLRIFAAVVECKGFAAAQVKLNLSISSISSYITALEQRLGMRLCDRGRSGFALTDKGAIIHREALRVFAAMNGFSMAANATRGRLAGTLKIGHVDCTVSDPNSPMMRALRRFNGRDHDVRIELLIAPPADLQRGVLDGHLHLAVACFPTDISGLATEPLYDEVNRFYCGAGHPLFAKSDVGMEEVRSSRIVARGYWRGADLSLIGVAREAASVDVMEAQAILILSGAYLGYLPEHYAASWVAAGRLRCLLPEEIGYVAPFALVTRRGGTIPATVRQFVDDLRASLPTEPARSTGRQRTLPLRPALKPAEPPE